MIKQTSCLCLLLIAAPILVSGQCPQLAISAPTVVEEGEPIIFDIKVTGGDRTVEPTFNWAVSNGTISSGQGTTVITVDTTGASGPATATADVGGYMRRCQTSKSATVYIERREVARKIDEYGAISPQDRTNRLDNFAIGLQSDPTTKGYVIAYGGRSSASGTAASMLKAVQGYLVDVRGTDSDRIVLINGGKRERPMTELWIVPRRAVPPKATPSAAGLPAKKTPATKKRN